MLLSVQWFIQLHPSLLNVESKAISLWMEQASHLLLILLQVAVSFEQNQCFNLLMVVRVLLY